MRQHFRKSEAFSQIERQSLNEEERMVWYSLLDPARFYDAKKRAVINLPENYLGVAVRVAAVSYELGVLKDRDASHR